MGVHSAGEVWSTIALLHRAVYRRSDSQRQWRSSAVNEVAPALCYKQRRTVELTPLKYQLNLGPIYKRNPNNRPTAIL